MKELVTPDEVVQHIREDTGFYGYRADLDDLGAMHRASVKPYAYWRESFKTYDWEPPKELDPRPWYDVCSQGSVGSCQGVSLADAGEYLYLISHGEEIQLSRAFAYIASQEMGGGAGRDYGSSLSGGTRAAKRGIPLESEFEYTPNYRSQYSEYKAKKAKLLAGKLYKFPGAISMPDFESCYRWLSSWSGTIHIGIAWSLGGAGWEVSRYSRRGGGHAVLLTGYLKRPGWEHDVGILLKNSHSTNWGRDGWALIKPSVVDSWCRSQTVVGRSDMRSPTPRVELVDNYNAHMRG